MKMVNLMKLVSSNEWVERTAVGTGFRPRLYMTFPIYVDEESILLSVESEGLFR